MNEIDFKKIEFEFEEDWDIFEELFSDYLEKSVEMIVSLKSSYEKKDFPNGRIQAHTLKGVVSNFYFEDIRLLCQKIESDLEQNKIDTFSEDLVQLEKLNDFLLKEVSNHIEKKKAG